MMCQRVHSRRFLDEESVGGASVQNRREIAMEFIQTPIHDLWIVDPLVRSDKRGSFSRIFAAEEFESRGLEHRLVHVNEAVNEHVGTLRGLHYQEAPHAEDKLVRCLSGAIHDVVVDMREDSPTYRETFGIDLDAASGLQLYIPKGFAHGYQVLRAHTRLNYFCTAPYAPSAETGLRWDDPALGIEWPLEPTLMSERDLHWKLLDVEPDGGWRPNEMAAERVANAAR